MKKVDEIEGNNKDLLSNLFTTIANLSFQNPEFQANFGKNEETVKLFVSLMKKVDEIKDVDKDLLSILLNAITNLSSQKPQFRDNFGNNEEAFKLFVSLIKKVDNIQVVDERLLLNLFATIINLSLQNPQFRDNFGNNEEAVKLFVSLMEKVDGNLIEPYLKSLSILFKDSDKFSPNKEQKIKLLKMITESEYLNKRNSENILSLAQIIKIDPKEDETFLLQNYDMSIFEKDEIDEISIGEFLLMVNVDEARKIAYESLNMKETQSLHKVFFRYLFENLHVRYSEEGIITPAEEGIITPAKIMEFCKNLTHNLNFSKEIKDNPVVLEILEDTASYHLEGCVNQPLFAVFVIDVFTKFSQSNKNEKDIYRAIRNLLLINQSSILAKEFITNNDFRIEAEIASRILKDGCEYLISKNLIPEGEIYYAKNIPFLGDEIANSIIDTDSIKKQFEEICKLNINGLLDEIKKKNCFYLNDIIKILYQDEFLKIRAKSTEQEQLCKIFYSTKDEIIGDLKDKMDKIFPDGHNFQLDDFEQFLIRGKSDLIKNYKQKEVIEVIMQAREDFNKSLKDRLTNHHNIEHEKIEQYRGKTKIELFEELQKVEYQKGKDLSDFYNEKISSLVSSSKLENPSGKKLESEAKHHL